MAAGTARGLVGQWPHSFASGCLGEADRIAGGDDDVGVVQETVDGGVGDRSGQVGAHDLLDRSAGAVVDAVPVD